MPTIAAILQSKKHPQPDLLDVAGALDRIELPDTSANRAWLEASIPPLRAKIAAAKDNVLLWRVDALDRLRCHLDNLKSLTQQLPPNL